MKSPVVNYRDFRFSKLNTPQYSHLLLLLGWVIYFTSFFLVEKFIPYENCFVIHSFLDELFPFCEVFVIPYVYWYFLIVFSLVYFALYNPDNFRNLMKYILFTQFIAIIIFIVFPSRQDLRPVVFPRDNFLTDIVALLYSVDTNTNVCPSLHVTWALGIASTWLKEKSAGKVWKVCVVISTILICLSTVFIKQHSILDVFAAIPLCLITELVVFAKYWHKKIKKVS